MSKGEERIKQILQELRLGFKTEFTFYNLKKNKPLRFDFYVLIPSLVKNIAIEFDGEQHFKAISHWGGERGLKKRQEFDRRKNQYCLANSIPLFRIPYWKLEKLNKSNLLEEENRVKSIWHNDRLVIP